MFSASKSGRATSAGYSVGKSLRFRSSATAYLNRTPSVAGNAQKFTWSGWVKRGSLSPSSGSGLTLIGAGGTAGTGLDQSLVFHSAYTINFSNDGVGSAVTSAVFRDPSAWYHVVLAVDTTQATQNNRAIVYVNGVLQSWSTVNSVPLTQNQNTAFNTTTAHTMGKDPALASNYFDGYMAEVNFIDGQALTASSFGTYDTNGVWQPVKYSGSYGTNGFYLNFGNTTSTTTLGYDTSGNGNNWTTNNISLTAGSTYDSMTDSPTVTSASVANYNVVNPLAARGTTGQISNANLTFASATSNNSSALSTLTVPSSGFIYLEAYYTVTAGSGNYTRVGVTNLGDTGALNNAGVAGTWVYDYNLGQALSQTTTTNYTAASSGQTVMMALDMTNGKLYAGANGTWYNSGNPVAGTGAVITGIPSQNMLMLYMLGGSSANRSQLDFNFGQRPFTYTPPTGFNALNTYNLPTPTITNGAQYMAATLYTGTGANQTINDGSNTTIGTTFQPDFVWVKIRNTSGNPVLVDSIRGANKTLYSPQTSAEETSTAGTGITSFNSNGFSLGTEISGTTYGSTNTNGNTYVGWQWKANGTGVSNTNGSITSTVSANTTAGFSVVTYTGTGSNATVGHGLGVAPSMVITKTRTQASVDWHVYHSNLTSALYALDLNDNLAQFSQATAWNSTAPTSSVFSVGSSAQTNGSGQSMVAYCWAAVAGYSAFGSYTGNGSTSGPFVYTGFRPRFIMVKRTDSTGDWYMWDTSRNTYNVVGEELLADSSAAGSTATDLDILSNGFCFKGTTAGYNASSGTYIYMAFAENPFNYSRAR